MARYSDTLVAVMILLRKDDKVLLQKRKNTGYMDGYWDFSATGHVESNESIKTAGVREMLEEINVKVNEEDMQLLTIMHKFTNTSKLTYINAFFIVDKFEEEPSIGEVEKIEMLEWFSIEEIPDNLIPDRKLALDTDEKYLEIGW